MKCSNCGHETNKAKLTLTVDRDLIAKAKKKGINISQLLEEVLKTKYD
jgi:post-segregation antitoxin (ccd killing protein)